MLIAMTGVIAIPARASLSDCQDLYVGRIRMTDNPDYAKAPYATLLAENLRAKAATTLTAQVRGVVEGYWIVGLNIEKETWEAKPQ